MTAKRFQTVVASPLAWFFAVYAIIVGIEVALWSAGRMIPPAADLAGSLLLGYLLALWVLRDSGGRLPGFPSDWSFLAGVVIVPAYFMTTRGARGLGLIALFVAGVVAIEIAGWLVSWVWFTAS